MTRILTPYERETIILFNETTDPAEIFTYDKSWQSHLEKKVGLKPIDDNGYGGKTYKIGKKRIKPPRAKIELPPMEKEIRARRLADARNLRKSK